MEFAVASLMFLSGAGFASGESWDYAHMSDWHHDYPMCGLPNNSPINIHSETLAYDSSVCSSKLNWTVDWSVHAFKVSNNGHSLAVTPMARIDRTPGMMIETNEQDSAGYEYSSLTTPANSIARLPNYFLPQVSNHSEFCLHSFHFHWGLADSEGSEHLLDDTQYPLEVHFVHYACDRDNLGDVLGRYPDAAATSSATADGEDRFELAVVGLFFDITEWDNPAFDAILSEDVLDQVETPGDEASLIINTLYLQDIIPQGVFTDGYYAYQGSLTTPPCTDIVRWHVMKAKSYIGKSQIERFRNLMDSDQKSQAPNFRETVTNVNPVYACFPAKQEGQNALERAVVWTWGVIVLLMMAVLGGVCHCRSKRESVPPPQAKPKRERLFTASSNGHGHAQNGHH